jgi:DNA repair exonuclease SbcCD ATPase subunit
VHIHELKAENFKRLISVAVTFPPNGTVEICGANGQGKSSLIDSIWSTLGGQKASPEEPIRQGSRTASVELDLGEIRVRREWTQSGTSLTVTDADGLKRRSPQAVLDALFDRLAFDPMAFTRQDAKGQAETLRSIAGLDFRDLDGKRKTAFEERTQVNRSAKDAAALLNELPVVEKTAEVSLASLSTQLKTMNTHNREVARAKATADRKSTELNAILAEIATIQERLHALDSRRSFAEADYARAKALVVPEMDTDEVTWDIESAEATNKRARAYAEREAAEERLRFIREQAEDLTTVIENIDAEKARRLAAARFPVDGLSVRDDVVTYRGIPFDQVSTSEQIIVSLGIGAASNKDLRYMAIKEGSLLDERNLRAIAAWAQEHDYQVIVERVADRTVGAGVMIEEGLVVSETTAANPRHVVSNLDDTRFIDEDLI